MNLPRHLLHLAPIVFPLRAARILVIENELYHHFGPCKGVLTPLIEARKGCLEKARCDGVVVDLWAASHVALALFERYAIVLGRLKVSRQPVHRDLGRAIGRGAVHLLGQAIGDAAEPGRDIDDLGSWGFGK